MSQYRAKYDFSPTGRGQLTLKVGDAFTIVNKTNEDWWMVRSASGELGLAPATYLEAHQDKEDSPPPVKTSAPMQQNASYVTLYDFKGQDESQLTFSKGETLLLLDKTDHSWWSMKSKLGKVGFVPVNYIDKLEGVDGVKGIENGTSEGKDEKVNGGEDENALAEVLLSIDRAMQKIHDEATKQEGTYTSVQRAALQSLVTHRQNVVQERKHLLEDKNDRHHTTPNNTSSKKKLSSSNTGTPNQKQTSPSKTSPPGSDSPTRVRRVAPPPPTQADSADSKKRPVSVMVDYANHSEHGGVKFRSLPRRNTPHPPQRDDSLSSSQEKERKTSSQTLETATRHPQRSATISYPVQEKSPRTMRTVISSTSQATDDVLSSFSTFSTFQSQPASQPMPGFPKMQTRMSPHGKQRSSSIPGVPLKYQVQLQGSPELGRRPSLPTGSPKMRRQSSGSGGSPGSPRKYQSSPRRSRQSSSEDVSRGIPRIELPTFFPVTDGAELVEKIRVSTGMSYNKSLLAVGGVLEFLKTKVPVCSSMVDALFTAVHESQSTAKSTEPQKAEGSSDLDRLREIFFQLTECRDDSQQRGWAVHDDQQIIMDYLDELLQILCDADPEVAMVAFQEDKYENILTLLTYYQMESRVPIRLLLLKVFGVLCGMDKTVISVLLTSVLPNELGRDIQHKLTEIQKTLYSCTVCTMIFSSGEAVPLPVYDQWSEEYVLFLLDTIESPPEEDEDDQIPDGFLNVILSFNQHFQDPSTNLVMKALKQRPNPRNFSEKMMFLINRGEDPVAISTPCCPDSLTKFLLDVFSDTATSGMFYTTDMMVLIDIVSRQLHDLGGGDETRSHYLELLYRIVCNTEYKEHNHRRKDLTACLSRIAQEENVESLRDHEIIKKLWIAFPGIFEEVTDL